MIPFQPEKLFSDPSSDAGILSVVEASAGTGKTFAISHLVPRFLLEGAVARLDEVVLVTFTNDAARELSDRTRKVFELLAAEPLPGEAEDEPGVHALRSRYPSAGHRRCIANALLDIDRLNVSTIHSFCQRIIQTEGALCGLPSPPELIPDHEQLVSEALYDLWTNTVTSDPLLSAIAKARKWSEGADLRVVRQILAVEKFVLEPAPIPLDEARDQLSRAPSLFTPDILNQLSSLVARVPDDKWNKKALGAAERENLPTTLSSMEDFSAWINAIEFVAGLGENSGGMIAAKGAAQKALISEASGLEAVRLACEFSNILAGLVWSWQAFCAATIRASTAALLHRNRQITYDGLIGVVRDALASPTSGPTLAARLRSKMRVALVDESQDTDLRQFEIFDRIFLGPGSSGSPPYQLVLVGDPKQAIYEFRGADVNTYLKARARAGKRVFTLNETYRSPAPLVAAANALFGRKHSLLKENLEFSPARSALPGDTRLDSGNTSDAARIEVWVVPDNEQHLFSNNGSRVARIAASVASHIAELISSEAEIVSEVSDRLRVGPKDFAVLVSSHQQGEEMRSALTARGIPAIRAKASDIFCSEEAGELRVLLHALVEPRSPKYRSAALATRLLGRTTSDLRKIAGEPGTGEETIQKFLLWHELFTRSGLAAVLAEIDASEQITLRLAQTLDGERRITNLRQLTDLLQKVSTESAYGPASLLHWLVQTMAAAGDRADTDERQQQLESDAEAVQIVTMHAAKGLEFNLVFCPFLWSMPSSKSTSGIRKLARFDQEPLLLHAEALKQDSPFHEELNRAALEDRLRLAYVALTRARVKAWVCAGACCGGSPLSALDWLLRKDTPDAFSEWVTHFDKKGRGQAALDGLASISTDFPEASEFLACKALPSPETNPVRHQPTKAPPVLRAVDAPVIPSPWGITSFSALTREKDPKGDFFSLAPGSVEVDLSSCKETPGAEPAPIFSVPGGARLGTAIHDWIEQWDFSPPDPVVLAQHMDRYQLPRPPGCDATWLHETLLGALQELRGAVLPEFGATIEESCPNPSASEWHFHLPIRETLTPQKLADVFRAHGADSSTVSRLSELPALRLEGYLQGFIDRIAFHKGCWGVIDWKTNFLGPGPESYDLEALTACAYHSHYFLQAHLYLIALRRWLGPAAKIAGAWLVFLRPVRSHTSEGILPILPAEDLLTELDTLFFKP